MYDSGDEYIKKENNNKIEVDKDFITQNFLLLINIFISILYIVIIYSVFIQFIPIQTGNWFNLGMGKYVGIAAIFGIYFILTKNYFAAFFISLFSSFFVLHEVIIFYDNYSIELGKELGSDGLFRLVLDVFKDAFNVKCGAFWAVLGSFISFIFVTYAWISNTVIQNRILSNKAS